MSRHCLYCAKELPKGATNNFCSKECWTEYKKLKAMDVGTDKQATVLLKRSDLADSDVSADYDAQDAGSNFEQDVMESPDIRGRSDSDVFDDLTDNRAQTGGFRSTGARKTPTEITSISERLTNLEVLLNEKLGQQKGDAQGLLDDITRKIDDLAVRQNKLEVDLEKVDVFLRSVDKFEDRIRRLERQVQTSATTETTRNKGFFARLFS